MIRQVKRLGKEYLLVFTTLQVQKGDTSLSVPVTVQINITDVDERQQYDVYKSVNLLFNHPISINHNKVIPKKPWYKFW